MNKWIKQISCLCLGFLGSWLTVEAEENKLYQVPFDKGTLVLCPLQDNAVRIRYVEDKMTELPEWIYVASHNDDISSKWNHKDNKALLKFNRMSVQIAIPFLLSNHSYAKTDFK